MPGDNAMHDRAPRLTIAAFHTEEGGLLERVAAQFEQVGHEVRRYTSRRTFYEDLLNNPELVVLMPASNVHDLALKNSVRAGRMVFFTGWEETAAVAKEFSARGALVLQLAPMSRANWVFRSFDEPGHAVAQFLAEELKVHRITPNPRELQNLRLAMSWLAVSRFVIRHVVDLLGEHAKDIDLIDALGDATFPSVQVLDRQLRELPSMAERQALVDMVRWQGRVEGKSHSSTWAETVRYR